MCRSTAEGGRRCNGRGKSGDPAYRRVVYAAKMAKKRYRGPKDVPCTEMGCTDGIKRWVDAEDVFHQDVCDVCKGSGFLNDASGRLKSSY